jgi:hypothetical protein
MSTNLALTNGVMSIFGQQYPGERFATVLPGQIGSVTTDVIRAIPE